MTARTGRWRIGWIGLVAFGYYLLVSYSRFLASRYGYHDLGLINDFMGNTAYGRGAFLVSETGASHLGIHFTPTLFLVAPLWRWVDSPELLIWLNALAVIAGVAVFRRFFEKARRGAALPLGLGIALFFNPFVKEVVFSAHFEPLFIPFASWALLRLWSGERGLRVAVPFALALGVRQDAGVFLGFQCLALLALPRSLLTERSGPEDSEEVARIRRRAMGFACAGLLYSVCASRWGIPFFGGDTQFHVARFWGKYGNTWGDVFAYSIHHPAEIAREVWSSGFRRLQLSSGGVTFLSPILLGISQLPGALLFISQAHDKKQLLYYNSAFLLPGFFLAFAVGYARLESWLLRLPLGRMLRFFAPVLPLVAALSGFFGTSSGPIALPSAGGERREALLSVLSRCPKDAPVAADFRSVAFVPNSHPKLLLDRVDRAGVVVISGDQGEEGAVPDVAPRERIAKMRGLVDWQEIPGGTGFAVFARRGLCGG